MKEHKLLENERICEECGCIYHIHYGCCSTLPCDITKFNETFSSIYQQVKELSNMIEVSLDSQSEDLHYDCELFRDKVRTILEFMSNKVGK